MVSHVYVATVNLPYHLGPAKLTLLLPTIESLAMYSYVRICI